MKLLILISLSFLGIGSISLGQSVSKTDIKVYSFDKLEPLLHLQNDTIYLVNFWASWCIPCREEMPDLIRIQETFLHEKFKVLLVSMDLKNKIESQLIPYIISMKIHSEVVLLDDPRQNMWIDKVDKSWGGDIPYTLVYRNRIRHTYARSVHFSELDTLIRSELIK